MSLNTNLRMFWKWLNGNGLTIMRPSARRILSQETLEDRILMTGGIHGPLRACESNS